jgi:hypothetical protein
MQLTNERIEKLKFSINRAMVEMDWKIEEVQFFRNGVVNAVFLVKEKERYLNSLREIVQVFHQKILGNSQQKFIMYH